MAASFVINASVAYMIESAKRERSDVVTRESRGGTARRAYVNGEATGAELVARI